MRLIQILNGIDAIRSLTTVQNGKAALKVHRIVTEADEFRNDFNEVRDLYLEQNPEADNQENEKHQDFRDFLEQVLQEEIEPSWVENKLPVQFLEDSQLTAQHIAILEALEIIDTGNQEPEKRENRLKAFQTLKQS